MQQKGDKEGVFRSISNSEGIRRLLLLSALFLLPFSFFRHSCTLKMTIWTDSYLKLAANTFSWHSQTIAFKEGLNGKAAGSSRKTLLQDLTFQHTFRRTESLQKKCERKSWQRPRVHTSPKTRNIAVSHLPTRRFKRRFFHKS